MVVIENIDAESKTCIINLSFLEGECVNIEEIKLNGIKLIDRRKNTAITLLEQMAARDQLMKVENTS